MSLQNYLDQEIKKICPIDGISFGNLKDKKTWYVHFIKDATDEQKKLALDYLEKFVWTDDIQKEDEINTKTDKYKDDLNMKQGFIEFKKINPNDRFIDYINYLESIDVMS